MAELTIVIPARNEMFLARTIEDLLANIRGDTEILAICDGYWPTPEVKDHPRVNLIHYTTPQGQRQGTNAGARLSQARYLMKVDAHCAFDEGFDVNLMEAAKELGPEVTQVPRMYNLHAFDWVCRQGHRRYQGPSGPCTECGEPTTREVVWKPRLSRRTDFARFDRSMHFQYWREYEKRPEAKGEIADLLCCVGAAWFMPLERYWQLDGMDERHGSWGQMGVELACKSWLSGGRQVVNKRTWFAHMFRTQGSDFGFPYKISATEQEEARKHSRWLWEGGNWPKAKRSLQWLVDQFAPVPEWHVSPA